MNYVPHFCFPFGCRALVSVAILAQDGSRFRLSALPSHLGGARGSYFAPYALVSQGVQARAFGMELHSHFESTSTKRECGRCAEERHACIVLECSHASPRSVWQ